MADRDRETDREGQTDRQTDRQTDSQSVSQSHRQGQRQTERAESPSAKDNKNELTVFAGIFPEKNRSKEKQESKMK